MKVIVNTKDSMVEVFDNNGAKLMEKEFAKSEKLINYIEKIGHDVRATYDFNNIEAGAEAAAVASMALKLLDNSLKRVIDDGAVGELEFVEYKLAKE